MSDYLPSDFENHTSGLEEYDEMPIATVHVTNSWEKRRSCSAPVPDTFAERMGKEIRVFLPPVSEPPAELEGEACQSKLYWQVVTDELGSRLRTFLTVKQDSLQVSREAEI